MQPLDCHLPTKKVCFEARNKGFVSGQRFVSTPETNVSVRKRFVSPKLLTCAGIPTVMMMVMITNSDNNDMDV